MESMILGKNEGLYDPSRKFAFTNITGEDFVTGWNKSRIVIKSGSTVKLDHSKADNFLKQMVDKIMMGGCKMEGGGTSQNEGMSLGVPAARRKWEEKVIKELPLEDNSEQAQIDRASVLEELQRDMSKTVSTDPARMPSIASIAGVGTGAEFQDLDQFDNLKVK